MVSTPQDVSLKDAVKGVEMMRKVNVPVSSFPPAILFQANGYAVG